MIETIFDTIEKAVDIVDRAVTNQDYSQMSKQINDLFHPKTGETLYKDVREQYPNNKYRAGHMENSKSSVRQEPPIWARTGGTARTSRARRRAEADARAAAQGPPSWAQRQGGPTPYAVKGRQTVEKQKRQAAAGQRADAHRQTENREPVYIRTPSVVPSILMIVFGALGLAASVPIAINTIAEGGLGSLIAGLMGLIVASGFGVMVFKGISRRKRLKRLEIYKQLLGTKLYADVKDLASAVKKPIVKVVNDLRGMISEKIFPQGHLDKTEQTFMATDAIYQNYLDVEARAEELKHQQEAEDAAYAGLTPEARAVVKKGKVYVDEIREANANIPDPVVTGKLNRMEAIVTRIFTEVHDKPELAGRLTMLMEYYLPTTGKLLKAYRDMSEQPIQGENIKTAKAEIENSLDTINDAFEHLLDSFFEDEALDLSTDISVMTTVMKQQGLMESDLKAEKPASESDLWETGPTLSELNEAIRDKEKVLAGGGLTMEPK